MKTPKDAMRGPQSLPAPPPQPEMQERDTARAEYQRAFADGYQTAAIELLALQAKVARAVKHLTDSRDWADSPRARACVMAALEALR